MSESARFDLSGDELEPEDEPPAGGEDGEGGKRRRRKSRGGDEKPGARTQRRHDAALRGRLEATLDRLAEWLEGRGDLELAGIIREDSRAMIGGVISVTRPLEWLRPPIVAVLAVLEPMLAFGRVGRVLAERAADRRERRRSARELELDTWNEEGGAGGEPEPGPPEPPLY